ncbi:hypothetical protein [Yimella sp. cx-51]|uniref:hypothetical protein n=1 Tax=Yimella sp. cx-51 TaxID=2770551 RepID=UPI00165E1BC2|nr:hypothetical protein [Yimella sp. cx-51]MBC9955502.1 hypothetical protein [Yimella sp. cx-51]QTH37912.1 hypothetical protein J5M86_13895 [Yimella sp. cx-51]
MSRSETLVLMLCLSASNAIVAVALGWTTSAAADGRLKLNTIAGIRTARTMRLPAGWRAGHAAAWPRVRMLVATTIACTGMAWLLFLADQLIAAVVFVAAPSVLVVLTAWPIARIAGDAADAANE